MIQKLLSLLVLSTLGNSIVSGGDWPSFRGVDGSGRAPADQPTPTEWGPKQNIKWRTELPGNGFSSPIVSRGKVFLTCDSKSGTSRMLLCFDRDDGGLLWERSVVYRDPEPVYQDNPHCSSTPVTDGERVVVWHGSAGVHCYSHDGEELWSKNLGRFQHIWGYASSPVVHKNMVYLNCGPGKRSFMICLDVKSGNEIWRVNEPGGNDTRNPRMVGSWSTPRVVAVNGQPQLICSMPTRVVAYDLESGEILWWCGGLPSERGDLVYTSPLVQGDLGVAFGGFKGPSIGFELGGKGNVTEQSRIWRVTQNQPQRIGSAVALGEHLYIANAGPGTIECITIATGEVRWRQRLSGNHWGSVVGAGDQLYVTNQAGVTRVFRANSARYESLADNDLGEPSNASPAISAGEIFLRTDRALYCVSAQGGGCE